MFNLPLVSSQHCLCILAKNSIHYGWEQQVPERILEIIPEECPSKSKTL